MRRHRLDPIGIGDPEPRQRPAFARFHVGGAGLVMMIVAEQMEGAVNQQMRGIILDGHAFSAASASHTPRASTMSPSNSSAVATFSSCNS